jgi:hypothetical protein
MFPNHVMARALFFLRNTWHRLTSPRLLLRALVAFTRVPTLLPAVGDAVVRNSR